MTIYDRLSGRDEVFPKASKLTGLRELIFIRLASPLKSPKPENYHIVFIVFHVFSTAELTSPCKKSEFGRLSSFIKFFA